MYTICVFHEDVDIEINMYRLGVDKWLTKWKIYFSTAVSSTCTYLNSINTFEYFDHSDPPFDSPLSLKETHIQHS